MFTSFAFVILLTVLCAGIWFWVRKNDQRTSDTFPHHSPSGGTVEPVERDQPAGKSQPKQSAATVLADVPTAAPTDAETFQWTDRRLNERWRDWLALTTTIIALGVVFMYLQVSKYLTLSIVTSAKEANAWSYFQAKSVKQYNCQIAKTSLELQLQTTSDIAAEVAEKYRITIKKYDDEIKRYKDEKEEIQQLAIGLGKKRVKANKIAAGLDNSLGFLMMGIVLSSIATMVRKKYIWYISLTSLAGWLYFLIFSF